MLNPIGLFHRASEAIREEMERNGFSRDLQFTQTTVSGSVEVEVWVRESEKSILFYNLSRLEVDFYSLQPCTFNLIDTILTVAQAQETPVT